MQVEYVTGAMEVKVTVLVANPEEGATVVALVPKTTDVRKTLFLTPNQSSA